MRSKDLEIGRYYVSKKAKDIVFKLVGFDEANDPMLMHIKGTSRRFISRKWDTDRYGNMIKEHVPMHMCDFLESFDPYHLGEVSDILDDMGIGGLI